MAIDWEKWEEMEEDFIPRTRRDRLQDKMSDKKRKKSKGDYSKPKGFKHRKDRRDERI